MSDIDELKVAEEYGLVDAARRLDQIRDVEVRNVEVSSEPWSPGIEVSVESREYSVLKQISDTLDEYDLVVENLDEEQDPDVAFIRSVSRMDVKSI